MVRCAHTAMHGRPRRQVGGDARGAVTLSAKADRRRSLLGLVLGVLVLLGDPQGTLAGSEQIRRLDFAYEGGHILVSAALDPGLSPQTEDEIRKGISKDLYYYVVLKQRQKLWFDEEKAAVTVKYSIKYNLLKQEYAVTVRLPSGTTQSVFPDFERARGMVSQIDRIPVAGIDRLRRRKTYLISVKAEMKAPQLPLYLDYFLFFIPFLEIDTPWANTATFRAPDAP